MQTNPDKTSEREVDAEIAVRLFGWQRGNGRASGLVSPPDSSIYSPSIRPPKYSTDPAASRKVIERMRELGWAVTIMITSKNEWWVQFWMRDGDKCPGNSRHESFDLAICKAALAALDADSKAEGGG